MAGRPPRDQSDGLPDFKYVNRLPLADVARKIGCEVQSDGTIACPRYDRHDNRKPGLLTTLRGNKVECVACKTGPLSIVDWLMNLGEFTSAREAVSCFARDLDVPHIAKGSHLKNPDCQTPPPACDNPISLLVLSGVWQGLLVTAHSIIPALLALAGWHPDNPRPTLRASYRAIARYSGIKSPNAIKKSLDELEGIGWLERLPSEARGDSPIKNTAAYCLTPLSERVKHLADVTAPGFGQQIEAEKEDRKFRRLDRQQRWQSRNQGFSSGSTDHSNN
jgi:hypothetical protein